MRRRLVDGPPTSFERLVADTMRADPELVAGTGQDDTLLMRGVPGLLSRVGAAVDSVDEGVSGYTVDVGDSAAIRMKLDALVTAGAAKRREMGQASLKIVRERFCFETQMEKIEAILDAIRQAQPLPA